MVDTLDDLTLQELYTWIDEIPLSRPKKNIARDFCDGVLMAEIVKYFFPKLVELHNYSAANGLQQKMYNWATLNQKALKKIGMAIPDNLVEEVVSCKAGAIELVLCDLKRKIEEYKAAKERKESRSKGSSSSASSSVPISSITLPGERRGVNANYNSGDDEETGSSNYDARSGVGGGSSGGAAPGAYLSSDAAVRVDTELLVEKERTIVELREIIKILERKIVKLDKLVTLKSAKIAQLQAQLSQTQPDK